MEQPRYLLLRASADCLPLRQDSVALVIATPPMLGVGHRPRSEYCTRNAAEYDLRIEAFLRQATRVVQPHRHILLIGRKLESYGTSRRLVFHVLQKQRAPSGWRCRQIGSETFLTHFVDVKTCPWWAIPVDVYRRLIQAYSAEGEIITHVFSGSGNGAIAALQLRRIPVLVDLHYHRQVGQRLLKTMPSSRTVAFSFATKMQRVTILPRS